MKYIIVLIFVLTTIRLSAQLDSLGCSGILGDVKYSILQADDFQALNGDCWVLMDGRNISSTKLGALGFSNLPDPRGYFIRIHDNRQSPSERVDIDRQFDDVVGFNVQKDEFKSHSHSYQNTFGFGHRTGSPRFEFRDSGGGPSFSTIETSTQGGSETRPQNITMNLYIRIN